MNRDKSHEFAMKKVDDLFQRKLHMTDKSQFDAEQLRKIREDILDSIDEELEMALEDGENENDPLATPEEKPDIHRAADTLKTEFERGIMP